MVPSTSTSPTTVLKDAVTTFVQSANHALALAEESSKADLSLALQNEREAQRDRDDLRRERDKLLQEKMESLVELEGAKREGERWKAASEKAEWMIDHQAETISQLRKEAQQWKDQFMRVEEERSRLSSRVDELVAQQLYVNRSYIYNQEPLTPRSQASRSNRGASTSQQYSMTTSATTSEPTDYTPDGDVSGRVSRLSSGRPPQSQISSSSTVVSRKKSMRATGYPSGSSKQAAPYIQPQQPLKSMQVRPDAKQMVIRRVHAVVEVPVKEESVDSQNILAEDEITTRSQSIEVDNVSISYSDGIEEDGHGANESASSRRPARSRARGRLYKNGAGRTYEIGSGSDGDYQSPSQNSHEDDDEEDELMLGFEDNRTELYGTERLKEARASNLQTPPPPRRAQTQAQSGKFSGSAGTKRNSPYPATTSKKVRRR